MATIEERIQRLADKYGAEFVNDKGWHVYELWLTDGETWDENGSAVICRCYANDSQSWKRDAYRDIVDAVTEGKTTQAEASA